MSLSNDFLLLFWHISWRQYLGRPSSCHSITRPGKQASIWPWLLIYISFVHWKAEHEYTWEENEQYTSACGTSSYRADVILRHPNTAWFGTWGDDGSGSWLYISIIVLVGWNCVRALGHDRFARRSACSQTCLVAFVYNCGVDGGNVVANGRRSRGRWIKRIVRHSFGIRWKLCIH